MATIPPWHRSGTLTSPFSAWRLSPDPWSAVASIAVAAAAVVCALALRRPARPMPWTVTWTFLAGAGAAAALGSLARAPDFFSATPAPLITALAGGTAGLLGLVRARRFRP